MSNSVSKCLIVFEITFPITTPPTTVLVLGIYMFLWRVAIIATKAPCCTFKVPFSIAILKPLDSNKPTEIIFLFNSGTYQTSFKKWIVPSCNFSLILPFPKISQVWSLPMMTKPSSDSSRLQNHSFFGHIWKVQAKSKAHSFEWQTNDELVNAKSESWSQLIGQKCIDRFGKLIN